MPHPGLLPGPAPHGFNPRPPVRAGDAMGLVTVVGEQYRFNPRPPVRAGDASQRTSSCCHTSVSIRARR